MAARRLVFLWGSIMEDLLAKFYGKPESEGSSDAPRPDESTPQPERDPQHNPQLEQRVSLVETQLLQMAKSQQTILARLDTMIEQQESQPAPQHEPPPPPKQAWRPAWKEPRPEPPPPPKPDESIGEGEGTPLNWDPINNTLHAMDDVSDDPIDHKPWEDPSQQEQPEGRRRSDDGPKRACTICGRQFPLSQGKMAPSSRYGPETLHCPKCYSTHQDKRKTQIAIGVVGLVIVGIIVLAAAISRSSKKSSSMNRHQTSPTPVTPHIPTHPRFPIRR